MGAEDLERTETGQDLTLAMVTQSTDARRTVAREHGRTEDRIPSFWSFPDPPDPDLRKWLRVHPRTSAYVRVRGRILKDAL